MSSITCYISSLPPELLYTILSHALADILFDYLFVGALLLDNLPNHQHQRHLELDEISSLGGISVAWRATLHRILTALLHLHRPNQDNDNDNDDVQSLPTKQKMHQMHRVHHHQLTTTMARAHPSPTLINSSISISAASASASASASTITITINSNSNSDSNANAAATTIPSLQSYQRTLHTMQIALRDLVQHSIDTYRNEQDLDVNMGGGGGHAIHQTGVTTPTLLPPPPVPVQTPASAGIGIGVGIGTPPLVPHSIPPPPPPHPPHSIPPAQPNFLPPVRHNHLFSALLLIAAPTLKDYTTTPLFQAALCYSQAAIFTCQSSSSSSSSSSNSFSSLRPQPSGRWNIYENSAANANANASASASAASTGMRVQRQDLSTLILTTPRLVAALEWVGGGGGGGGEYNRSSLRENNTRICPSRRVDRICPREVCEVVGGGMGEVRERIEDAIRVCRWNDLLHAVFLRGERSDEMLEALDGCFDDLEANAASIQMHHLLRSNLFKTVQTIARLRPISLSLGPQSSLSSSSSSSSSSSTPSHVSLSPFGTPSQLGSNTPPNQQQQQVQQVQSSSSNGSNGEIWRCRAGALAFRWMGRVVEWTGL